MRRSTACRRSTGRPIVLCYLEGLTTEAAARRLACAQGTIMSRLSRGRDRLRQRLTRRGLAPASGLLTAGLSARRREGGRTGRAWLIPWSSPRCRWRRAQRQPGGSPATVAALTEGVLRMMVRSRLRGTRGGRPGSRAHSPPGWGCLSIGPPEPGRKMHQRARPQRRPHPVRGTTTRHERRNDRPASLSSGPPICRGGTGRTHSQASLPSTHRPRRGGRSIRGSPSAAAPSPRTAATWSPRSIGRNPDPREAGIWVYDLTGQTPPRRIFEREGPTFLVEQRPAGHHRRAGRRPSIGTSRPGVSMPMARAGPGCRSPTTTSSLIAPATARGSRRGPSAANPTHKGRLTLVHPDGTGARYLTEGSANDDLFLHLQDLSGRPEHRLRRDQDCGRCPALQALRRGHRGQAPTRDPGQASIPAGRRASTGRPMDRGWH